MISHTHCQAAQNQRTSLSLSKNVFEPTHGRKESTIAQHCIRVIAGEVVESRSVHLINFCGGGQVIALKSASALILDHDLKYLRLETTPGHADVLMENPGSNFGLAFRELSKRPMLHRRKRLFGERCIKTGYLHLQFGQAPPEVISPQ